MIMRTEIPRRTIPHTTHSDRVCRAGFKLGSGPKTGSSAGRRESHVCRHPRRRDREPAMAEKLGVDHRRPGDVPPLSAYAYQRSVSLPLAGRHIHRVAVSGLLVSRLRHSGRPGRCPRHPRAGDGASRPPRPLFDPPPAGRYVGLLVSLIVRGLARVLESRQAAPPMLSAIAIAQVP
jgi:hypothetical protein